MKIYIVHRDVPYEFGEVWGVFLTEQAARQFISVSDYSKLELGIEIWETDGNLCVGTISAPVTP